MERRVGRNYDTKNSVEKESRQALDESKCLQKGKYFFDTRCRQMRLEMCQEVLHIY